MTGKLYAMGEMLIDFTPAGEDCRRRNAGGAPVKALAISARPGGEMRRLCRERTVSAILGHKRCAARRGTALLLRTRMQRRDLPLSRSMRGVLSRPPQQSHFRADGGRGVRQVRAEQGRWGIMTNSQEKEVPPRAYARGGLFGRRWVCRMCYEIQDRDRTGEAAESRRFPVGVG